MSASRTYLIAHAGHARRLISLIGQLTFERGWIVRLERNDPKRTIPQNAKLRVMEREIAEFTGDDPDSLHEDLLKLRFGTVTIRTGGHEWRRPARRSSDLNTAEMAEYITWVQAFAARELGMELL